MNGLSVNTLQADLAKTVLQGGYMVTAVKHGKARTIINPCPFYITTNQVPEFGADDIKVKRRIVVFETKSLPNTDMKAEDWIRRNAMKYILWTISKIEEDYSEIEPEELWYEYSTTPDTDQQVDYANDTCAVFDLNKVDGLREAHLIEAITGEPEETSGENYGQDKSDFLHESFMQIAAHEVSEKIKRLPGKEIRQQSLLSDMESEYESDNDPRSPSVVSNGNAYKYHKRIFNQLQFSFYRPNLEPYHLYNFRYMQKTSKSNQEGNDGFEAWMLVAGENLEGFNCCLFFWQFPDENNTFSESERLSIYKSCENLILCNNMLRMMALFKRSRTM